MRDPLAESGLDELPRHAGFLRALVRDLLRDEHEVDDVLQRTYLAAVRRAGAPPRSWSAWMAAVARNLARMWRRTEGRRRRSEREGAKPEQVPSTQSTVARIEVQQRIVAAVRDLREPYRTVILLRFYDGLPPREIARRLGVPRETVRTRIRRALAQLRDRLDRDHDGDRGAWCVAVFPLAKTAGVPVGGTLAKTLASGVVAMKGKLIACAVVLGVVATVLLLWQGRERTGSGYRRTDAAQRAPARAAAGEGGHSSVGEPDPARAGSSAAPSTAEPDAGRKARASGSGGVRERAGASDPRRLMEQTGETEAGSIRVIVTDQRESPVVDARLLLNDYSAGSRPQRLERTTAATGQAEFRGVKPGRKQLSALANGWHRILYVEPVAGRMLEVRVTIPGVGAVVEGSVTMSGGGLLTGISVRLWRRDGVFNDYLNALTDETGRYRFGVVAPGTWRVSVNRRRGVSDNTRAHDLEVPAGGVLRHDIEMGVVGLAGTVTDARTGRPVAGATVYLHGPIFRHMATDENGRFRFTDLADGRCSATVRRDGYQAGSVGVFTVEEGRGVEVDVALEPAIRVQVRLLDSHGRPLMGRFTLNARQQGSDVRSVPMDTDDDGRASTHQLAPGEAEVDVTGRGLASEKRTEVLEPGMILEFRLAPKADGKAATGETSIVGGVADAISGEPIPGVRISLERGYYGPTIYTDAKGSFAIRGLSPGKYTLHFSKPGHGFHVVRDLGVAKGGPTRLTVALQRAATLRLRVTDAAGAAVPGEMFLGVHHLPRGEGTSVGTSVTADGSGIALFRRIVPGTYDLYVKVEGRGSARVRAEVVLGDNLVEVRLQPPRSGD